VRIRGESGYSLIEVMATIMLLTLAILPMAGMFDMGLKSATKGSNYDRSRALANLKMEEAKSLSFAAVENDFPEAGNTTPYDDPALLEDADFPHLKYRVEKEYIEQPTASSVEFNPSTTGPTKLIRITVIVQWGDDDNPTTYTTFGLVAE
jgi:hypothetical protein